MEVKMRTKTKNLLLWALLVFVFTVSSCKNDGSKPNPPEPLPENPMPECEGVDTADVDFSNIEKLYEQPLCIIKKCVQGKWKLIDCSNSASMGSSVSDSSFFLDIDIKNNNVVITGNGNGTVMHRDLKGLSSVSWEFKGVYEKWGIDSILYCSTFVMQFNDRKKSGRSIGWYFEHITNDKLEIINDFTPIVSFSERYEFLRIKE